MGVPGYSTRRRDGIWPIECACHICGVLPRQMCWDMRYPMGTQTRSMPHRQRGERGRLAPPAVANSAKWDRSRICPANKGKGKLDKITLTTLRLLAEGKTYREIARIMNIKYSAVQNNARDVLWRMGAECAAHAVHLAYQQGILRVDDSQFPACRWCQSPLIGRDPQTIYCDRTCWGAARRRDRKRARDGSGNPAEVDGVPTGDQGGTEGVPWRPANDRGQRARASRDDGLRGGDSGRPGRVRPDRDGEGVRAERLATV